MALSITGEQVESVLRQLLPKQGYEIRNPPRECGETGADIIVLKKDIKLFIECIGFQDGAAKCVIALPIRFKRGMSQRARHYGEAWTRIGVAFPEIEIWFVDVEKNSYEVYKWNYWADRR